MNRRDFNSLFVTGAIGAATGSGFSQTAPASPERFATTTSPALMHVGCQQVDATKIDLQFRARHGVTHVEALPPKYTAGIGWDLADALARKKIMEQYGVEWSACRLPLSASGIDVQIFPNIMLGKSPARDNEIKILQQMIKVAGQTGIRVLTFNTTILKMLRTDPVPGRGGSEYRDWDYAKAAAADPGLTIAGNVTADQEFERISYMLERLLPVAEENKVQLANHIPDPPIPKAYRGVMRWDSPDVFAGIKRYSQLSTSPCHGFSLCLGSIAEGLNNPNSEIHDIIRYVGQRKQIFNVHFRNIRGGFNKFSEVYHDEGSINMFQMMRTLRDVGYQYMLMPDHAPTHPDDLNSFQAYAFAYGYIKALIQAVNSEKQTVVAGPEQQAFAKQAAADFELSQNAPNPFNASTKISYTLKKNNRVRLTVFNPAGRKVCTLLDARQTAGNYSLEWDGRDDSGRPVPGGMYLYMLDLEKNRLIKRMNLVK